MSDFVLSKRDGGGWQGRADPNLKVRVEIRSRNPNVVMEGTLCSSSVPPDLKVEDGRVVFPLVAGPQALTVTIKRLLPPLADWKVVEVDGGGNSQTLDQVLVDEDPDDPFSLNINIMGV